MAQWPIGPKIVAAASVSRKCTPSAFAGISPESRQLRTRKLDEKFPSTEAEKAASKTGVRSLESS